VFQNGFFHRGIGVETKSLLPAIEKKIIIQIAA
jgi:hypothetical protein